MKALIIGATGATGKDLVYQLLQDPDFKEVDVFVRKPININDIGVIYKIENKLNKKIYIGQTVDYKRRLWEHCRSEKKSPLYNAFKKYGFNNFQFSIIDTAITINELNEKSGKTDKREMYKMQILSDGKYQNAEITNLLNQISLV